MLTTGLLDLPIWGLVLATLALTHLTIIAVTVYLHRCQAHRALDLHPAVAHVFRFWLWLTTGMVTAQWVAIHRKHHARCETPEDPHSPQVLGLRKVMWEGTELYRRAAADPQIVAQYGHGTPNDWMERHVYSRHQNLGPTTMLVVDLACFGVLGLTVWAIQMVWIPFWAAGIINGVGHYWGYRNFEPRDAATNVVPWGVIVGGEELHNNHHAFPSSAKLSSRSWEFDIGWGYIRILSALRLATVRRLPPSLIHKPEKTVIDRETVKAVVTARLLVMNDFARQVVLPVLRDELRKADASVRRRLKRHRGLLVREQTLLTKNDHDRLQSTLDLSQTLRTVMEYRGRLQALWDRTAASQDRLLANLQEWCAQAESSGVRSLQEFARSLRGYSLIPYNGGQLTPVPPSPQ